MSLKKSVELIAGSKAQKLAHCDPGEAPVLCIPPPQKLPALAVTNRLRLRPVRGPDRPEFECGDAGWATFEQHRKIPPAKRFSAIGPPAPGLASSRQRAQCRQGREEPEPAGSTRSLCAGTLRTGYGPNGS